ncbi:MAG: hypothetical protein IAI48_11320, partial [Candidatus Eremiobacteraeota bacterium]|nr:hypothetical protein [Candidatus Eremiobacteraeota bacterium]
LASLDPDDAPAWAAAIDAIANDPDAADRAAAARRDAACARFAWSTAASRTNEAYARAILAT